MKKLTREEMLALNPGDEIKVVDMRIGGKTKHNDDVKGKVVRIYEAGGFKKIKLTGNTSFGTKFTQNVIITKNMENDGTINCSTSDNSWGGKIHFTRSVYLIKENPKTAENLKKVEEDMFAWFKS